LQLSEGAAGGGGGGGHVKLLFWKELKQSDVGSLGRIVLPKVKHSVY
jgi:hypothetical protein